MGSRTRAFIHNGRRRSRLSSSSSSLFNILLVCSCSASTVHPFCCWKNLISLTGIDQYGIISASEKHAATFCGSHFHIRVTTQHSNTFNNLIICKSLHANTKQTARAEMAPCSVFRVKKVKSITLIFMRTQTENLVFTNMNQLQVQCLHEQQNLNERASSFPTVGLHYCFIH